VYIFLPIVFSAAWTLQWEAQHARGAVRRQVVQQCRQLLFGAEEEEEERKKSSKVSEARALLLLDKLDDYSSDEVFAP
jgi:hypothetical protein